MAIGCYTEPYLPASFNFITFKAMEVTSEHGRRGAEGEFPFAEITGYADLGRRIRVYTISARFDSNDHVTEAAALIAACELPGPGVLTHPTRGVINAACRSLKVTDEIEEGQGVTTLDMEFVEANVWNNGLSLVGQLLGVAVNSVIEPSRSNFTSRYVMSDVQAFRVDAVVAEAQEQIANINTEYAAATTDKQTEIARNRIINDLGRVVADASLAVDTDIVDKAIARGMSEIARELSGVDKFRAFRRLANGAAKSAQFAAPAGDAEDALYSNVRVIAAAYTAEGIIETDELTGAEIFEYIDVFDTLLAQEMTYARTICANELYMALADFRTETIAAMYNKAYSAPGLISYNFSSQVHPLNAAYSIFNDAKKHRSLENLNNVGVQGRIGPLVTAKREAV